MGFFCICPPFFVVVVAGGYITGSGAPRIIREAILRLCGELKDDAVSLVDVIAPTDFILNSPIGASDGEVSLMWRSISTVTVALSSLFTKFPWSELAWLQSSELTEPLWTDSGLKSETGVCELIHAKNNDNQKTNKKSTGRGCFINSFPSNFSYWRIKPPPPLLSLQARYDRLFFLFIFRVRKSVIIEV